MNKVIAKDGIRLDQIVYEYYGSLQGFEVVQKANIHLINKQVLETGDIVYLPEITKKAIKQVKTLWD